MNRKKFGERYLPLLIAFFTIGALVGVIVLDVPHGDFGKHFGPGEVDSKVIMEQGHIQDPSIPEGLIVLGAGQPAVLKFEVYNKDPDNDIDTIEVAIPGSTMESGSHEWYKTEGEHEWNYDIAPTDKITFEAQDDFTGSEGGETPYYDTAGNVDDALDFIEDYDDGDNPVYDLSEGITLSVSFNTTDEPGFKMGGDSINLKVGDLQTEVPGAPLTSFEPFPYPYVVADNDDKILVMILDSPSCFLEVQYGEQRLFSRTRSGDFMTSQYGFEYITDSGETVAVLEDPGDIPVKPMVGAEEDEATGTFTLDIYEISITDIETGAIQKTVIVNDYQDDIPQTAGEIVDNDIDDDGIFNNDDDDMDGDGIPNSEDKVPKIYNLPPYITDKTENLTVLESDPFTIMVDADDPESEDLTYTWTHDGDPEWTDTGSSLDLTGFDPGVYLFSVEIMDGLGNTRTETIKVTINDNLPPEISSAGASKDEIIIGDELTLSVNVSDPENKAVTCTWTHDLDPAWKEVGNPITVTDLEKGDYVFTVTVDDGWSTSTATVSVTVKEEEGGLPWLWIIVIAVAVLLLIIILVVVMVIRKKKKAEPSDLMTGQGEYDAAGYGGEEITPEASYEGYYDANNQEMAVGSYSPDAPLEFYPEEPKDVVTEESREGASMMQYPDDLSNASLPGTGSVAPSFPEAPPTETLPSATLGEPEPPVEEETPQPEVPPTNAIPPPPPPIPGVPQPPK